MSRFLWGCVLLIALGSTSAARGLEVVRSEFSGEGTWQTPVPAVIEEQLSQWLTDRGADEATRARITTLRAAAAGANAEDEQLDLLALSFAEADERAAELVALCSAPRQLGLMPDLTWLVDEATPAFERNNLRLYLGRWLVRNRLFDEALVQLETLEPDQVIDPAGLLFYQTVVYQRLLKKGPGLAAIQRLLEKPDVIPRRYASLGRLLQADLEQLKDDSLDHISRRMDDVERRLNLGRPGQQTRDVEDGIIKSLDKLIKELEDQAAAAAAAAGAQGTTRPSSPAQDSTPMGGQGPGQVARKDIGNKSGWGDLPPKERQEALQQIGKEFPAHYRDMVEQYFRELASEGEQP